MRHPGDARGEPAGLVGIYSDPAHVVDYTDGEIRQELEITLFAQPVDGQPRVNAEAVRATAARTRR